MNHVTLMGNVTRDPELKHIPSGSAVCELGLAVNKKWKDKSGNQQESVCFVDCTCWNRTAEIASEYLQKGSKVLLEGELVQDSWEDKNGGGKRTKHKITVNRLHLLPNGKAAATGEASQEPQPQWSEGSQESEGEVPF